MFVQKKPDEAVSLVYEFVNRKLNGDLQDQPDKILRNWQVQLIILLP